MRKNLDLNQSLLDKLINDEVIPREKIANKIYQLSRITKSLARDLENLLNSRRSNYFFPEIWSELYTSIINYGIPDITGKTLDTHNHRHKICETIRRTILNFEPRLIDPSIEILNTNENCRLHLRIKGLLLIHGDKEMVSFDSILQSEESFFHIEEVNDN